MGYASTTTDKLKECFKVVRAIIRGDFVLAVTIDQSKPTRGVRQWYVGRTDLSGTMLATIAVKNLVMRLEDGIDVEAAANHDYATESLHKATGEWAKQEYGGQK